MTLVGHWMGVGGLPIDVVPNSLHVPSDITMFRYLLPLSLLSPPQIILCCPTWLPVRSSAKHPVWDVIPCVPATARRSWSDGDVGAMTGATIGREVIALRTSEEAADLYMLRWSARRRHVFGSCSCTRRRRHC